MAKSEGEQKNSSSFLFESNLDKISKEMSWTLLYLKVIKFLTCHDSLYLIYFYN